MRNAFPFIAAIERAVSLAERGTLFRDFLPLKDTAGRQGPRSCTLQCEVR